MTVRCGRGPGPTPGGAPAPKLAGQGAAVEVGAVGAAEAVKRSSGGPSGVPAGGAWGGLSTQSQCPLSTGVIDTSLIPWPGMRFACVRVLELYCKVFNQIELYELIIRCVSVCVHAEVCALCPPGG